MKKQKAQSHINLETLAGGAFAEKLNEALLEVAENIQNPNTDAVAKRGITIAIKFSPNKTRNMVSTSIAVQTKLAPTEAIDTQMIMGVDMRTGEIEVAEYDGQLKGQMSLFAQPEEKPNEEPEEIEAEQEQTPEQKQTAGKLLDLRNRGKKQEPEMVPGRDFDPATGEVYSNAPLVVLNKAKA